ncbi:MAG TPA: histidine kinase, partial [Rhodothermales bacterium]|nr:histidine kinase [Rhodothermales bacterium]
MLGVYAAINVSGIALTMAIGHGFQPTPFLASAAEIVALYALWVAVAPVAFRWMAWAGRARRTSHRIARHLAHVLVLPAVVNALSQPAHYGLFHLTGIDNIGLGWGVFWSHALVHFVVTHATALLNYAVIVGAGLLVTYARRERDRREQALRLEAELSEARLQVIKSQLKPHFLFNALNTVSSLVSRRPEEARTVIARLSELLRRSLEAERESMVPLSRELGFVRSFLEIMQSRFRDRVTVVVDADDAATRALVPAFLLQPIVENAFTHGVSRRLRRGHVEVVATCEGAYLHIRVRDNGPGRMAEPTAPESGRGFGLRSTRARLEEAYGARYRLELQNRDEGGV